MFRNRNIGSHNWSRFADLAIMLLFGVLLLIAVGHPIVYTFTAQASLQIDHVPTESHPCSECLFSDCPCITTVMQDFNRNLGTTLFKLLNQKYLHYFKVDLSRPCPFWKYEPTCTIRQCSVEPFDPKDLPPIFIQNERLSSIDFTLEEQRSDMLSALFEACQDDCKNFCPVNDRYSTNGVYVNLLRNPERFTGYNGPAATELWESIYRENCFLDVEEPPNAIEPGNGKTSPIQTKASASLLDSRLSQVQRFVLDDVCLEKRAFYKLISGLHASISTHLCHDYFDESTGNWNPNVTCYYEKLGAFPDRQKNLYFLYAFLVRTLDKLGPYLLTTHRMCSGDLEEDERTTDYIRLIHHLVMDFPSLFREETLFADASTMHLKEEFRRHFRNISRIMDCVGCDKCRLWGKLQTIGIGTALKVMFSFDDIQGPTSSIDYGLTQAEVVAFLNTVGQVSKGLEFVETFERMLLQQKTNVPIHNVLKKGQHPHTLFRKLWEEWVAWRNVLWSGQSLSTLSKTLPFRCGQIVTACIVGWMIGRRWPSTRLPAVRKRLKALTKHITSVTNT